MRLININYICLYTECQEYERRGFLMDGTLERILSQLNEKKISASEMEKELCVPRGSFSNWKRGNGRLYYAYIDKIADRLGVSIDYLVRGFDLDQDSLSASEVELITSFRKMSDRGQKVILENAELLAEG